MELTPLRYYNQKRFPNTYYLSLMAVEQFFGQELFKGDASRSFYASAEYSFRRRLDMLNKNADQQLHSLDIPFMTYYRKGNWEVDRARPGIEGTLASMFGIDDPLIGNIPIRFMNVKSSFSSVAYFGRDDEAQIAHEVLLWTKHPSVKQFTFPGLAYKNYAIDIPIQLQIDNIEFNPDFKETEWLKKNRIITLKFDFTLRSVIIAPIAQGPKSGLFETESDPTGAFYITKEAYLDYFSSKNMPLPDEPYIDLAVIGSFENDPTLEGVFESANLTSSSVTLNWDYADEAAALFKTDVKITTDKGFAVDVPKSTKTYTLSGLEPESTYVITIWFFSTQDSINSYNLTIKTLASSTKTLGLKPIIG